MSEGAEKGKESAVKNRMKECARGGGDAEHSLLSVALKIGRSWRSHWPDPRWPSQTHTHTGVLFPLHERSWKGAQKLHTKGASLQGTPAGIKHEWGNTVRWKSNSRTRGGKESQEYGRGREEGTAPLPPYPQAQSRQKHLWSYTSVPGNPSVAYHEWERNQMGPFYLFVLFLCVFVCLVDFQRPLVGPECFQRGGLLCLPPCPSPGIP